MQDVQLAADGTRKLVSVLTSGEGAGKKVETVIIPMLRYHEVRVHKQGPVSDPYFSPYRPLFSARVDCCAEPFALVFPGGCCCHRISPELLMIYSRLFVADEWR